MSGIHETGSIGFEEHDHYKTWLRYKEASKDEKQWMHQRFGWMIAAQTALLAIYGFGNSQATLPAESSEELLAAAQAALAIISIIPFIGLTVALIGFAGTLAAGTMHWRWTSALFEIEANIEGDGILTFGAGPRLPARSSSVLPPLQSYIFASLWTYLILFHTMGQKEHSSVFVGIFVGAAFAVLVIIGFLATKYADKSLWNAGSSYRWLSTGGVKPRTFSIDDIKLCSLDKYGACIFDFDGVICDSREEQVFQLSETEGEKDVLSELADFFAIRCENMDLQYQRHLIYQVAQDRLSKLPSPGKASTQFKDACEKVPTFVLSARSGWYAVKRAHAFIESNASKPVETFQIGRVSKVHQIEKIMEEHKGRVIYFEDSPKHVKQVSEELNKKYKGRLDICFIECSSDSDEEDTREHYESVIREAQAAAVRA